MIRTQIYLDEEAHNRLTRLAQVRGEPMGKLVRIFVNKGLAQEQHKDSAHGLVALAQLAEKEGWKSEAGDVADRHNECFIKAWKENSRESNTKSI